MQDQLKELHENILPEAFEMLEEGKTIGQVRVRLGDSVEPKLKKIFVNKLNFYIKKRFRTQYSLLKNILVLCFSMFFALMVYIRVLDYFNHPEIYNTLYIILNVLLSAFFINVIFKLNQWEGSYLRSVIVLMFVFSLGDLLELKVNITNIPFLVRFVLQLISGAIAIYMYRNIFPTHGLLGAPKEIIQEKNILDDFR